MLSEMVDGVFFVGIKLADTTDDESYNGGATEPPCCRDGSHEARDDEENRTDNVKEDG